jgi:topoisomerase-4 subunit A
VVTDGVILIAVVSNEGRMLVFPIDEMPRLTRGKGSKMINISSSRLQAREEFVVDYALIVKDTTLVVHSGKRYLSLKNKDLDYYCDDRGRKGHKLPRGFQRVDRLVVE